jgi:L-alanine-DL-glutamate epimerase-like enolase superfamily enzyme
MKPENQINLFETTAYTIPTDFPESDGTLSWNSTTLVVVHVGCSGRVGTGYTYGDSSLAVLIEGKCKSLVLGTDAEAHMSTLRSLHYTMRNIGDTGLTSMAIAAIDNALWDLRSRLYEVPLAAFLGLARPKIEAYGSGGFTSYTEEQLCTQLEHWADSGFKDVKIKIGNNVSNEQKRVKMARTVIGDSIELFVDANGAFDLKNALLMSNILKENSVSWFEEPVRHTDTTGLHFLRERCPPPIRISVGEYGFELIYFKDLLTGNCVDVLQADATRCGMTGFRNAASLCEAFNIPLSAHTAPSLHVHICCSVQSALNVEYFHDHVRIEHMLFDGAAKAENGFLLPDLSVPGNGLQLKKQDAEHYRCF